MTTPIVKSLIDEQIEEVQAAQVRGTLRFPVGMRVADLPYPIKADWLKRRPIARPRPCP
ncbi:MULTISPECIES: hypothetical protein [Pseudomonadota]|uniref:hypothetical protein n=1 Tax=Pseudomonadota TaxID=1224 RepID=UPI000217350E|nr:MULTISPECIES: hypothetical protein [Pseudomonadota]AEJ13007.1 hypothetical protein PPS_2448 [Pseudomonas putida S16]MBK4989806.1 hypothetical protein [Pseudomonas sp. S36]UJW24761.1 hypothetical protein L2Y89_11520 [Pseudomonas juntendi]WOB61286.1 hypothetical protein NY023_12815 [Pseudomonas sp. NBB]HWL69301.1 hypothetical protein [Geminicoccus sp.]